jgi:hypothetical protein
MSDLSLNHDLYGEANSRRHHEAEAMVRSRSHQRAARSARSARSRLIGARDRRVRVMAVAAPTVGLVIAFAATLIS